MNTAKHKKKGSPKQLAEVKTTLDNGQSYKQQFSYKPDTHLVSDKKEFDFSNNLVRETTAAYDYNWNRPTAVTVYGPGGSGSTPVAQTLYDYDTTALTLQNGASHHDDTNYGLAKTVRGNLTRVRRLVSPGTFITTATNYYNTLGELITSYDGRGNLSASYDYTDAWSGSGCVTSPTYAYPTTVTAGGLSTKTIYNPCDGSVHSVRDQNDIDNARNGTIYTYDAMQRVTEVLRSDGGSDHTTYPTLSSPTITTQQTTITSSLNKVDTTETDTLGRVIRTTNDSDPDVNGPTSVTTDYDALGRVWHVTNPHRSPNPLTDGTTTSQYDALGRVNLVTEADGSTVTTSYSGPCTTVTDEVLNQRKSCTDALGHLSEVDEPGKGPDSYGPGIAGTGSVTISGTLQSRQTQGQGTSGTGSASVTGSESTTYGCSDDGGCMGFSDTGYIYLTVNGYAAGVNYDQNSTSQSLATALAAAMNASGPAYATASGSNITLTAKTSGSGTNYSYSITCSSNFPSYQYPWSSVGLSCGFGGTSGNLSGGHDGGPVTTYDSGTTSVTVNGQQISYPWSGSSTTSTSIASGLATAVNTSSTYATATASGSTLNLTARTTGAGTNYSLSTSITGQQYGSFSTSASGGSFTSGADGQLIPGTYSISTPYVTLYSYDPMDNLLCVEQHGNATGTGCSSSPSNDASSPWRVRRFSYDSLSRLTDATNPESGHIQYTYDGNGNVLTKTAPAPNQLLTGTATVTTTYSYDVLNRKTYEGFSDGTYRGDWVYDQSTSSFGNTITNPKGRLTSSWQAYGGKDFSYDSVGHVTTVHEIVNSNVVNKSFLTQYGYDLAGDVTQITYPSGRAVTYSYGGAGRVLSATDSNGTNYGSGLTYWPNGAPYQWIGSGVYFRTDLNKRLQISGFYSDDGHTTAYYMNKTYDYNDGHDNGNVQSITNLNNAARSQVFTYDGLNRILSASSAANTGAYSWGENYQIDPWGNMMMSPMAGKVDGGNFQLAGDPHNRAATMGYDPAGNLTSDGMTTYVYDAGNMLKSVGSYSYLYDADGQRFQKWQGTAGIKSYLYGSGSDTLLEADPSGNITAEYIYLNGRRVARVDAAANLLQWSEQFGHVSWTAQNGATVTSNYTNDPNGHLTADRLVIPGNGALGRILQQVNGLAGKTATFSLYMKSNTGSTQTVYIYLREQGFGTVYGTSACSVTTSWNRCSVTGLIASSSTGVYTMIYQTGGTGSPNYDISAWGAQLELGSSAGPYYLTTTARPPSIVHYYLSDHLNSTSMVISGTDGHVEEESDFHPYGAEMVITGPGANKYKFTGGELDSETGLYHFGARQYGVSLGRFLSPDAYLGSMSAGNPQTLNRYTYVLNTPSNASDPSGLECIWDDGTYDSYDDPVTGDPGSCKGLGGTWVGHDVFASSSYYEGDWVGNVLDLNNFGRANLVDDIENCSDALSNGSSDTDLLIADSFTSSFSNLQTAYVLATAQGESGLGAAMTENISPARANKRYGGRQGNTNPGDGYRYRGHGYAQLTFKNNYATWSRNLGVDMVSDPGIAATPDVAAQILVEGLDKGSFTGVSLYNYVNPGGTDFVDARKTVNSLDRANQFAGYARGFASQLQGCR